jgi:hypothetical protein
MCFCFVCKLFHTCPFCLTKSYKKPFNRDSVLFGLAFAQIIGLNLDYHVAGLADRVIINLKFSEKMDFIFITFREYKKGSLTLPVFFVNCYDFMDCNWLSVGCKSSL